MLLAHWLLWPFRPPAFQGALEAGPLKGALEALRDVVYWAGARDGAIAASIVWIALILLALLAVSLVRHNSAGTVLTVLTALLGVLLWWGMVGRNPDPVKLPSVTPPTKPMPMPPVRPFRPWRRGELQ